MQIDSQEQIKKPKIDQDIVIYNRKDLTRIKHTKKLYLIKLFLLLIIFILVIAIAIVVFFIIKNKKKSNPEIIKSNSGSLNKELSPIAQFQNKLAEKNNSITAVYSLIKDEESVLFNPENSDEITAMMLRLEMDQAFYEQQKLIGLERAKLFSWKQTAENLLKLYQDVYQEIGSKKG